MDGSPAPHASPGDGGASRGGGALDARGRALLAGARLLALDVDGVLTDGTVTYFGDAEGQSFSVQDGQGLAWLVAAGVRLAWITGRDPVPARRRAEELGVAEYHARCRDKAGALREIQERLEIPVEATLAMGDDVLDLGLAARAAFFAAPANARPEVRARAHLVTRASGGAGAVRELAELVLRAKERWQAILDGFGVE